MAATVADEPDEADEDAVAADAPLPPPNISRYLTNNVTYSSNTASSTTSSILNSASSNDPNAEVPIPGEPEGGGRSGAGTAF